jgi:hypothetical protein
MLAVGVPFTAVSGASVAAQSDAADCGPAPKATGPGVTADAIDLGVISLDVKPLTDLGFAIDPGDQELLWRTFVDRANADGGVCGRQLDLKVFSKWNVLADGSARSSCLEVTQDTPVFAVIADTYNVDGALCVTDAGKTPLLMNAPAPKAMFKEAKNRLFTFAPEPGAVLRAMARIYGQRGLLDGKVGVLYGSGEPTDAELVESDLLPALEKRGIDVESCRIPASASQPEGAAAIPLCIEQFASAGVDTVIHATDVYSLVKSLTEAKAQGFEPKRYLASTFAGSTNANTGPLFLKQFGASDVYDGALGLTDTELLGGDLIEADTARECNAAFADETGVTNEPGSLEYQNTARVCSQVALFVLAAKTAGSDLTQSRFIKALEDVGTLALIGQGGSSFAKGKHWASDEVQTIKYDADCNCYENVKPFQPIAP